MTTPAAPTAPVLYRHKKGNLYHDVTRETAPKDLAEGEVVWVTVPGRPAAPFTVTDPVREGTRFVAYETAGGVPGQKKRWVRDERMFDDGRFTRLYGLRAWVALARLAVSTWLGKP